MMFRRTSHICRRAGSCSEIQESTFLLLTVGTTFSRQLPTLEKQARGVFEEALDFHEEPSTLGAVGYPVVDR